MASKDFWAPITWVWRYPKFAIVFCAAILVLITVIQALDHYSPIAENLVRSSSAVQESVGAPISSVSLSRAIRVGGIPGKDNRYSDYYFSVTGSKYSRRFLVHMMIHEDGTVGDTSITVQN